MKTLLILLSLIITIHANPLNIDLTKVEQEYLDSIETIPMCYNTTFRPYTMLKDGKPIGVSVDYLKKVEKRINKKFKFIYANSIKKQLRMVYEKKCSTIPLVQTSPQIIPFINATTTAGKDNLVLITKINVPYIFNMEKLKNKKIGIYRAAYHIADYLRKRNPNINYIKIEGNGLKEVENGDLFGSIGTSVIMNYNLTTRYKHSLKVMTVYDDSYMEGSIGVHSDEPILLSILNKAIATIDKVTQDEIFDKWIDTKYEKVIDYTLTYQILFISFLVLSGTLYWTRRLSKANKATASALKELELTQEGLKKSEEKFRTLFNLSPIMIDAFDKNGYCTLWNKECEKVFGWTIDEINEYDNTLALFYPDQKVQAEVIASFSDTSPIFREWYPLDKEGNTKVTLWANIKLPNGEIINVGHDITEQRAIELEILEKTNQLLVTEKLLSEANNTLETKIKEAIEEIQSKDILLQNQSRLAQMGEMIAMIAHQWRQPLSAIGSAMMSIRVTQKMQKREFDDIVKRERFLEFNEQKIIQVSEHVAFLSETIDNFRDFFKPDKVKEEIDPHILIAKTLTLIQSSIDSKAIELTQQLNATKKITIYENQLMQVIINLIKNAIDNFEINETKNPNISITLQQDTLQTTFNFYNLFYPYPLCFFNTI